MFYSARISRNRRFFFCFDLFCLFVSLLLLLFFFFIKISQNMLNSAQNGDDYICHPGQIWGHTAGLRLCLKCCYFAVNHRVKTESKWKKCLEEKRILFLLQIRTESQKQGLKWRKHWKKKTEMCEIKYGKDKACSYTN